MRNPFRDFRKVTLTQAEIPLARIVRQNRQTRDDLLTAFKGLDRDGVKELCRLLDHCRRLNVYKSWLADMELPKLAADTMATAAAVYESSLRLIQTIEYTPSDIEGLCTLAGRYKTSDLEQSGPMGLYISALINGSPEACLELNLQPLYGRLHFLGFRLEDGRQLVVHGDPGHFTGAGLQGGYLVVNGSTGSWCGADMKSGCIKITGNALSKTGEHMRGGQIQVQGRIQQIAKSRFGGEILDNAESE